MKVFTIDLYDYFNLPKVEFTKGVLTCYVKDRSKEICENRKSPAMLVLPGGGYWFTSDREAEPVALAYLSSGFNSFVLRYSCDPLSHPTQLREAAMAIIYIRENAESLGVNPEKVSAVGFSAGGHLCAMLATLYNNDCLDIFGQRKNLIRPDAVVLGYPVISCFEKTHEGTFNIVSGGDNKLRKYLSTEKRVTKDSVPAFIFATSEDDAVPVINSIKLAEAYYRCGVPFSLHIYEKGCHGLSLGTYECDNVNRDDYDKRSTDYKGWHTLSVNWLKDRGFLPVDLK